ncbi:hypothetical protein FBEOM_10106 [Fusarium beomiforme]|uniref:Uncharacterized protein n=1 Tax=Fusarium beomiforme TaxID=44412 RepID=A0A9P5AC51_9HYPO|nr:hypothetical protein FBEOM_10106 [Fusarium beomiforme]
MPLATGSVSVQNGQFTGKFEVEGSPYTLSGNVQPATESFNSTRVVLNYNSAQDIQGAKQFSGNIGNGSVNFTFPDGATITGPLDQYMGPASQVAVSAAWFQD